MRSSAVPVSARRASTAASSSMMIGASSSLGSSSTSSEGLDISARPIASICCWPPESVVPAVLARSPRIGKSANTRSIVHGSVRPAAAPSMRFSRTVNVGTMRRPWGTTAMPSRAAVKFRIVGWRRPARRTSPPVRRAAPRNVLTIVVFPTPLRPRIATRSPSPIDMSTLCRTRASP